MALLCIALYYRAIEKTRNFAVFRSKNYFRDFDGQESRVKYEKHVFFAINLHKYKFITTFAEDNTKGRTA